MACILYINSRHFRYFFIFAHNFVCCMRKILRKVLTLQILKYKEKPIAISGGKLKKLIKR